MVPIYLEVEGGPVVPEDEGGTLVIPGPRTDGGKVIIVGDDGPIVVAEQNHSRTCLATNALSLNCILVAQGSKALAKLLAKLLATRKGILITGANGNAAFIPVPDGDAGKNKILATDSNSNLVWVDQ